jgi:hypothetical protein
MNAQSQGQVYSRDPAGPKVEILGKQVERQEEVLTPLALQLLASLHRRFNARRLELLNASCSWTTAPSPTSCSTRPRCAAATGASQACQVT